MTTFQPLPETPTSGLLLPPPGRWWFDPDHTRVEFLARYLKVTNVRGCFRHATGTVTLGAILADTRVDVAVDVTSLDTGNRARDERLLSDEFLDAERHPVARFRSGGVEDRGHEATVLGALQLGGVTHPLRLEVAYLATHADPWGRTTAQFFASADLDRSDWGIDGNVPIPGGGFAIGDRIRLDLEVQLVPEPPGALPPMPSRTGVGASSPHERTVDRL